MLVPYLLHPSPLHCELRQLRQNFIHRFCDSRDLLLGQSLAQWRRLLLLLLASSVSSHPVSVLLLHGCVDGGIGGGGKNARRALVPAVCGGDDDFIVVVVLCCCGGEGRVGRNVLEFGEPWKRWGR